MKKSMLLLVGLLSGWALAAGPMGRFHSEDDDEASGPEGGERRRRMMLVVGLAEALELSESEALKMAEKVRGFEDRRRPLREGMREAAQTLKDAAEGKAEAFSKVDAASQKLLEVRQQMASLDKEIFQALAAGLSPQKKARLILFLGKMHRGGKRDEERGFMPGRMKMERRR